VINGVTGQMRNVQDRARIEVTRETNIRRLPDIPKAPEKFEVILVDEEKCKCHIGTIAPRVEDVLRRLTKVVQIPSG
jgi:hypothetical protein